MISHRPQEQLIYPLPSRSDCYFALQGQQLLYICSDATLFRNFVGAIMASGGGDGPEDIMGGFNVAFQSLSWRSDACKVLYMPETVYFKAQNSN